MQRHPNLPNRHVEPWGGTGFQFCFQVLIRFEGAYFRREIVELGYCDAKKRENGCAAAPDLALGSQLHADAFAAVGQHLQRTGGVRVGGESEALPNVARHTSHVTRHTSHAAVTLRHSSGRPTSAPLMGS